MVQEVGAGEEIADGDEDPVEEGRELSGPGRKFEKVVVARLDVVDEASAEAELVVVHRVGTVSLRADA